MIAGGGVGAAAGFAGAAEAGAGAGTVGFAAGGDGTPAAAALVGLGPGGAAAGAAGFGGAAADGAAGVVLAGLGVAGAGAGAERSSSQIAAHTPHVWILLVEALQAWAPQFGQWCSLAMARSRTPRRTYPFRDSPPESHIPRDGHRGVPQ